MVVFDDALSGFRDKLVYDGVEIAGALEGGKLAVGAGAEIEDLEGVGDLRAAAKVVHDVVNEPLDQLADEVASGQLLLLAEVYQLAVQAIADDAPLVLLDEIHRVDTERHVVGAQLPELGDDGLKDGGDADGFVYAGADVADTDFQRGIAPVGAHIPPNLAAVGDGIGFHQRFEQTGHVGPRGKDAGNAGAREVAEDDAAIGFEASETAHPEGRAGGKGEQVRQEIADDVHGINQEFAVFDANVYMGAKDEEAPSKLLHVLLDTNVALEWGDILGEPGGEGMRAGGGDLEAFPAGQLQQRPAQPHQLGADLRG